MLDFRGAAAIARDRIRRRIQQAEIQKGGLSEDVAIHQEGTSFHNHLAEAMRRSKGEAEVATAVFLAVPERLLGRWAYLAFGPQREKPTDQAGAPSQEWRDWEALGQSTHLSNFARTAYEGVLLTHGLSAISDTTLLLADIGRASRVATALERPLSCMLADVSWMSYNRSVRRFDLQDKEIEEGLRLCLDRRLRLYQALRIGTTVHRISTVARRNTVSGDKISAIADRYTALISLLWGSEATNTNEPLATKVVAMIGRPLEQSLEEQSPLASLRNFPGALQAMEKSIAPHLAIIRALAQKFRVLSKDTFSYYFAQYYAQQDYRGRYVKVAPESERDFDEPFDTLDESFRAWGEGSNPQLGAPGRNRPKRKRLTGVYLPQYRTADWDLLPYTPLSLDALTKAQRRVAAVVESTLLITDSALESLPKLRSIVGRTLRASGAVHLNRVVADLVWFLRAAWLAQGDRAVKGPASELRLTVESVLNGIHPSVERSFRTETAGKTNPKELWASWLDSIESPKPLGYTPSHLLVASLEAADWTEAATESAALLVLLANRVAMRLSD